MNDVEKLCLTEFDDWWAGLRAREAEAARRKAAAAGFRRDHAARRAQGLVARHAARAARMNPGDYPFPPDPECSE